MLYPGLSLQDSAGVDRRWKGRRNEVELQLLAFQCKWWSPGMRRILYRQRNDSLLLLRQFSQIPPEQRLNLKINMFLLSINRMCRKLYEISFGKVQKTPKKKLKNCPTSENFLKFPNFRHWKFLTRCLNIYISDIVLLSEWCFKPIYWSYLNALGFCIRLRVTRVLYCRRNTGNKRKYFSHWGKRFFGKHLPVLEFLVYRFSCTILFVNNFFANNCFIRDAVLG